MEGDVGLRGRVDVSVGVDAGVGVVEGTTGLDPVRGKTQGLRESGSAGGEELRPECDTVGRGSAPGTPRLLSGTRAGEGPPRT